MTVLAGNKEKICTGNTEIACQKRIEDSVNNVGYDEACAKLAKPMICYPSCFEVSYTHETSIQPFEGFDDREKYKIP